MPQQFLSSPRSAPALWSGTGSTGGLTDALGELVERADGVCTVRTRRSDVVIALPLVVAAKEVPPAPPRRAPRVQEP